MDRPEQCHRWLERINSLYQVHYDAFYEIVRDGSGGSVYHGFPRLGAGEDGQGSVRL